LRVVAASGAIIPKSQAKRLFRDGRYPQFGITLFRPDLHWLCLRQDQGTAGSGPPGALAAALHIQLPVAIDKTLLFLQNAAAPTALFVLGVTVALRPFDRVPWEVPGVIAIKLLVHPLIVFGLMLLFGPFAQPWAATAVLMASLPPALNVFVIARQNSTWIEPASVAVLIGTFASVVTLTSVMWFIQSGRLVFP
jgi:malonate transporter